MVLHKFHGEENEEDIQYIKAVTGKPVVKAVKVRDRYDVEAWLDSAADYLLFDSGMGSGISFDWGLLSGVDRDFFDDFEIGVFPLGVTGVVEEIKFLAQIGTRRILHKRAVAGIRNSYKILTLTPFVLGSERVGCNSAFR